jgi:hypothetical protein
LNGINFTSNNNFTGLVEGDYILTLKDATGLTAILNCIVKDSCVTVTALETDATCGNSNGSIRATGNAGAPPYLFSLDGVNFQGSGNFIGLKAGLYTVRIRDANGLTNTFQISVGNQAVPVVNISVTSASCTNNDAPISIVASGGSAPLEYSVDGIAFQL